MSTTAGYSRDRFIFLVIMVKRFLVIIIFELMCNMTEDK